MRKITILLVALLALFCTLNVIAGIKTSTAWWNSETFEAYIAPYDFKSTGSAVWSGWTTSYFVGSQTLALQSTGSASGNVMGFTVTSPLPSAFAQTALSGSRTWTKNNFSTLTGYIYGKTSFFNQTGGNGTGVTYSLKNSSGSIVFEFGGRGATSNDLQCTGVSNTTIAMGVRANWADIEFLLDLSNNLAKKITITYSGTSKTYTNIALSAGTNLNTLLVTATKGTGAAGLDNVTLGQLESDNIKTLTGDASIQTISSGNATGDFNLSTFTTAMSTDLDIARTDLDIIWSVSNWGGLSVSDQALVSVTRNVSDTRLATISAGNISQDATITLQAQYGSTTLTFDVDLLKASASGLKVNLNTEIGNANTKKSNVTDTNPYITAAKSTLQSQINASQVVYDNATATEGEINAAISDLQAAETAFDNTMSPYNTFVSYIGTVQTAHNTEVRTAPFFVTIKGALQTAINTATGARSTVETSGDITSAQSALESAKTQYDTDRPAYDNLNAQITTVSNRIASADLRKGDTKFLMYTTSSVSNLTSAKSTAESSRDTDDSAAELDASRTTLINALATFESTHRVAVGTSYYRIYTYGVNDGDGGSNKHIIYADGSTLKYKVNSSSINAASIWQIEESSNEVYTIKNVSTGYYLQGNTLAGNPMNFTFNDNKSQSGYVKQPADNYLHYNVKNANNRFLEVDTWDAGTSTGVFGISSTTADRYRFCYQFEPIATWRGTGNVSATENWANGSALSGGEDIAVATGTATIDTDITLGNISVQSGAGLSVAAGKKLTISNAVANSGTISLLADINGPATLTSGSGTAIVHQHFTAGRNWYISSPVSGVTDATLLGAASKVYKYSEPLADWVEVPSTEELEAGRGYIVQATVTGNVQLQGTLNDGEKIINLTRSTLKQGTELANPKPGFNLIGNPYPSYLNWNAAQKTNLDGTIYYRTKTGGVYKFYTYNGTSAGIGGEVGVPEDVTNLIPPMQAFWVRVAAGQTSGSVTFNNNMRAHRDQSNNLMKAPAADVNQVLRLQVSNGVNNDEALIYFNANASDGVDAYDSEKMFNNTANVPEIYTTLGSSAFVINGLNAVKDNLTLPLAFKTGETNSFTINALKIKNFDADTKIFLVDAQTAVNTDLTAGDSYTFTSDAITATNRFSVLFKTAAGTSGLNDMMSSVKIYSEGGKIMVDNQKSGLGRVEVFNAVGQKLLSKQLHQFVNILEGNYSHGLYIVKVSINDNSFTNRVIIN